MELKGNIRTFISYSHDSLDHKSLVLSLANQLCVQGIDCIIDQYEESPEEGWIKWMETSITNSAYVLVICTKGYFDKFNSVHDVGGKGVKWEGAIITQEFYDNEGKNRRFIPIIFGVQAAKYIPRVLKPFTYYDVMDDSSYEKLYRRLTKQPLIKKPSIGNVTEFPSSGTAGSSTPKPKIEKKKFIKQTLKGNNNIQIAELQGNISVHTQSRPRIFTLPSPGTIGANPLLRLAIKERFDKIGEEREKRFGKNAYSVMYKNFKSDFEITKKAWTVIWEWPEAAADTIIKYLDGKYANTIAGRNEGAIKKGTLIPSKGHLFAREKELLSQIDLEISSPEVKEALSRYFGVTSHTKLSRSKHWQWVLYLEKYIQKLIGE
jgi:hypothetical protein